MDFCPKNDPISAAQHAHRNLTTTQQPPLHGGNGGGGYGGAALSHLLSHHPIEGDETSEWLSVFVEDCFSSSGNYLLAPANDQHFTTTTKSSNPNPNPNPSPNEPLQPQLMQNPNQNPKAKPRKKARSIMKLKPHKIPSIFNLNLGDFLAELNPNPNPDPDPPLLHQAHWLADSEPIFPIHQHEHEHEHEHEPLSEKDNLVDVAVQISCIPQNRKPRKEAKKGSKPRKCSHCQAEKTPLWRQGPSGKGTLCNACGVRWLKSGNLFPEYRPANSPTFVSDLHSNVLRKVLKMREAREASAGSGLSSSDDQ